MLKAAIFDMDGVLVDSEPLHAHANVLTLRKFGLDMPYEYYLSFAGTTKYDMMSLIINEHGLSTTPEILVAAADRQNDIIIEKDGYTEIKGACELVRCLYNAGIKLAIASSSPYRDITNVLNYFHINDYFQVVLSGSDENINPKPASDIYTKALQLLNTEARYTIAIEDTTVGIQAACGAGIRCIGYRNPNSGAQDYSKAYICTDDFIELEKRILHL